MKNDGFGIMLFVSFGMAGLAYLLFKTGLPEAGFIAAVFFLFMFGGSIAAKCLEKK